MVDRIRANAQLVLTVARDHLDTEVGFDEAGVRWLDGYIQPPWRRRAVDAAGDSMARAAALLQGLEVGTVRIAGFLPDLEAQAVTWQQGQRCPDSLSALTVAHDVLTHAAGGPWVIVAPPWESVSAGLAARAAAVDESSCLRRRTNPMPAISLCQGRKAVGVWGRGLRPELLHLNSGDFPTSRVDARLGQCILFCGAWVPLYATWLPLVVVLGPGCGITFLHDPPRTWAAGTALSAAADCRSGQTAQPRGCCGADLGVASVAGYGAQHLAYRGQPPERMPRRQASARCWIVVRASRRAVKRRCGRGRAGRPRQATCARRLFRYGGGCSGDGRRRRNGFTRVLHRDTRTALRVAVEEIDPIGSASRV